MSQAAVNVVGAGAGAGAAGGMAAEVDYTGVICT